MFVKEDCKYTGFFKSSRALKVLFIKGLDGYMAWGRRRE